MKRVTAAEARAAIAAHVLGPAVPARLAGVQLLPHQRRAAGLLRRLLDECGGALLADEVGLGKTFVALAVAAREGGALVVAPAAVRDHWIRSARRADVPVTFASMESLSRGWAPAPGATLVIVDEAHHFRNPRTRRFQVAAALCRDARVLLLSATPVQNRADDLRAMLSLFLGERAEAADDPELTRHVVRRTAAEVSARLALPAVAPPEWLPAVDDVDCLDRILALPPAVPPIGAGDGGALVTFTLVRQWASSRAALVAALRRRLARGLAMLDALRAGRRPSRDELAGWCYADGAQQLFLPDLLPPTEIPLPDARDLVAQVEAHVAGARALLDWIGRTGNPDVVRAARLAALRRARPSQRIVAFSEFEETVTMLYRALAPAGGVAMLTHGGGRIASGSIPRRDVIASFDPGAGRRLAHRERLDLLLTTDVLSEGVNLPDASVCVHLDLAWNPARLEQRVGRLRRLDSPHSSISVFLCAPPAPAERLLSLERRLRVKRALAGRTVGVAGVILPGPASAADGAAAVPVHDARIAAILEEWHVEAADAGPGVASARSSLTGALACVRADGACRLAVLTGDTITEDREVVVRYCESAGGADAPLDPAWAHHVVTRVRRWLSARGVAQVITPGMLHAARSRRRLLDRVERIAHAAPRHARPALGGLLRAARAAATVPLSAGAEEVLGQLAAAPLPDDAWLHAVAEFTTLHARGRGGDDAVLAVLVLQP